MLSPFHPENHIPWSPESLILYPKTYHNLLGYPHFILHPIPHAINNIPSSYPLIPKNPYPHERESISILLTVSLETIVILLVFRRKSLREFFVITKDVVPKGVKVRVKPKKRRRRKEEEEPFDCLRHLIDAGYKRNLGFLFDKATSWSTVPLKDSSSDVSLGSLAHQISS